MKKRMSAFAFASAIGVAVAGWAPAAGADSASHSEHAVRLEQAVTLSAAKKKARVRRGGSRHIACTAFGCRPTPPGCYPTAGFDWWGNPTGFDVIVCPGRR